MTPHPALLLLSALFLSAAKPPALDLQSTLNRLNAASARFTSAEAHVHRDSYNAFIKEIDDRQDGAIYFLRGKDGTQMGLKTTGAKARTVEYKAGVLRDYIPKSNCFDTVSRPGIDTYLTLGFGGSGKDLEKVWNITDLGEETIGQTKVEHLDLTPKDSAVKASVTKVALWLDLDRDVTLKQVFYAPSNDTSTATYTDIKVNNKVDTKAFEIKGKSCGK